MPAKAWTLGAALATLPAASLGEVSFSRDIEPLLRQHCTICHGEALQQKGLRLDSQAAAMRGGESGRVIVPGDAATSTLIKRLEGLDGLQAMPPGGSLTAGEIGAFRTWIEAGAPWDSGQRVATSGPTSGHWAFRPIRRPEVPRARNSSWVRNPIDAFVLSKLQAEGLEPSPEATPATLLRRMFFDLTGLPPGREDLANAGGYETTVERLLESHHFGERWASAWLDQVRYADSDGYEKDSVRPHAWRYRHWVVQALNADMPFDRFTTYQVAGDLLPDATVDQRVATGFFRNTLKNREGGVNVEEFRFEEVFDRTNTVATVWLGLSMECARCHDHKYDPVTQKDYYRLFAFFNGLDEVDIDAPLPGEAGPYLAARPGFQTRLGEIYDRYRVKELMGPWTEKMLWASKNPGVEYEWDTSWDILALYVDDGQRILRTRPSRRHWREDYVVTEWFLRNYSRVTTEEEYDATRFKEAVKEVHALIAEFPDISRARAVQAYDGSRQSHVHPSGSWDDLGEKVAAGTPAALPPLDPSVAAPTRLDLARWLTAESNPLTARVAVNRIWQEYFGSALVATADNFGLRGEAPSHPDLLDWLASEFIESGWSLKHVHRLIVTSATYRQASQWRTDLAEKDPSNRLLGRQARLRLPAETLRDAALAVSNLLDPEIGGPSVRPYQPAGVTDLSYGSSVKWVESAGTQRYRRGIYIHYQRTTPYPFLANFDLPERNVTVCNRNRSNTPLQALNLLNDPVFFEMARGLAFRVLNETPEQGFADRLDRAFQLCLARRPSGSEREAMHDYFVRQRTILEEDEAAAREWFPVEMGSAGQSEDPTALAAWVGISRILLNMDEFITRE
ncbi:MAG: PSD1 and planctomycete cytochrome C domain-containing protein [Bryobacterales bacterium]|nr:PSD1 and planctomycete cytochrome C domain-containing protein [Bryobacterales bacterium]